MPAIADQLVEVEAKATLHSLLAKAMNYPDEQLSESIASGEFAETLCDLLKALGHDQLGKEVRRFGREAQRGKAKDLLLDLEKDYTRMFFASKPRLAYLFESVYREGKLLQESTFEIAGLYRDAGLVLNEDFRLPPDHIAVELEFLSFLFFKEIEGHRSHKHEAAEYARELQAAVIDRHLRSFAQSLAEKMTRHANTSFYRTIGTVLGKLYSDGVPD
jgi:putative dimethyl sulfoxide reductase chaperone